MEPGSSKPRVKKSKKTEKVSFLDESQRFIVLKPPKNHHKYKQFRKFPNIHSDDDESSGSDEQEVTRTTSQNEVKESIEAEEDEKSFTIPDQKLEEELQHHFDSEDEDNDVFETAQCTSAYNTADEEPFDSNQEIDSRASGSQTFVIVTEEIERPKDEVQEPSQSIQTPERESATTIATQTDRDNLKPSPKIPVGYMPNDVDEIRSIWYQSEGIGLRLIPKWQKQCMDVMDSVFQSYTVFSSLFQSANEILHQRIRNSRQESYGRLIILFWYVGLLISTLEPDLDSAYRLLNEIHGNFIQVAQCSIDNLKLIDQLGKKLYKMSKELHQELQKDVYHDFLARATIVDELSDAFTPVQPKSPLPPNLPKNPEILTIISFGTSLLLESRYGRRKTRDLTISQQVQLIVCLLQEILTAHTQVGNELRKANEMLSKHRSEWTRLDSSIKELVEYLKYLRKYVGFRRNLGSLGFSSKFKSFQQNFLFVSLERDNTLDNIRNILIWTLQASETCLQQAQIWEINSKIPSLSLKGIVGKSVRKLIENSEEVDDDESGSGTSCIQMQKLFHRKRKSRFFDNLLSFNEMFHDISSSNDLNNAVEIKLWIEREALQTIIQEPKVDAIDTKTIEPEIPPHYDYELLSSSITTHSFEVTNSASNWADIDTNTTSRAKILSNSDVLVNRKTKTHSNSKRINSGVLEQEQLDHEANLPIPISAKDLTLT